MQFKLTNYSDLERSITSVLTSLNSLPVGPELAPFMDGVTATDLNPQEVLQKQKEAKAAALPGAKEFRKAGVDLTQTIPDCTLSAMVLPEYVFTATTYAAPHLFNAGRYASYSQKAGKWVLNAAGQKALADAVTTLSGPQEKTYTMAVTLFQHVAQHSPALLPILFPQGKQGPRGEDLDLEWLVRQIKTYNK